MLHNIKLNGYDNVVPIQKAVSNTSGVVRLYTSSLEIGSHTLREHHDRIEFDTKQLGNFIEVESVTLDEFFQDKDNRVDVIKMDCEGSEISILLGMDKIVENNKQLKMFIEFYPDSIKEMGYAPDDLPRMLIEKHGFSITAIDELRMATDRYIEVSSVDEIMSLSNARGKIVNLFAKR